VIARNTAFTYKGQPIDVKQIGRQLGVRYVLEGGVSSGKQSGPRLGIEKGPLTGLGTGLSR
jgi:TolB-like protein